MILPIDEEKLVRSLNETGRVWIVGVYGMGKSLVAEWVVNLAKNNGDQIVRVNFKDLPTPTSQDIPRVAGYQSYLSWHTDWRERAEKARDLGRKLYIVVEEAQKTVEDGIRFWELLLSISYYYAETVRLVVTTTPKMLAIRKMAITRMMKGSVLYPRPLNTYEIREIVEEHQTKLGYPLLRYLSSIKTLSGSHYGTVKYLCQLLAENKYMGEKVSVTKVIKWVKMRGDIEYFLYYVWDGLSQKQQVAVRKMIIGRGKGVRSNDREVRQLVDAGLFFLGGREVKWRIPWVEPYVREYVERMGKDQITLNEDELAAFGYKERRAIVFLQNNTARVISYDELGQQVYLEEGTEFSLWALSQLMSRIRKKLSEIGKSEFLVTVRGVGYRWE